MTTVSRGTAVGLADFGRFTTTLAGFLAGFTIFRALIGRASLGLQRYELEGTYETGWDAADWNTYIATGSGAASTWDANLACDSIYATWTNTAGSQENLPISCVNWWEAYAFCIWDGGFLPSEAEWEYAAAGGSQEREYPWGATDPGTGSQYAIYDCYYPSGLASCALGVTNIAPVGTPTLGAGPWGQLDLVGEEWEWNLDWLASYVDICIDCSYLSPGDYGRVVRGGGFGDGTWALLPPNRSIFPYEPQGPIGFRCARPP
ncbi:MAG: SUMF1/EgtB/PvdO family nonheme iron enzyme [Polyangiaceae bacterium]